MGMVAAVGEGLVEIGLEPGNTRTAVLGVGGDAPNAAAMAVLAGAHARLGGRVGADAFGGILRAAWDEIGIDTSSVVVDPVAPTGIYVNLRGTEGLRRFDYHRVGSAGSSLREGDLPKAFLDDVDVVHVTGITLAVSTTSRDAALAILGDARSRGIGVSLAVNHRPALGGDVGLLREAARQAAIVFTSDEEVTSVFGTGSPDELRKALPDVDEIVVTRGGAGAVVLTSDGSTAVAGVEVDVVDPTGAGDALAGAYLARRVLGDDPVTSLELATAAASLSCRTRGCIRSYPTLEEAKLALATRL